MQCFRQQETQQMGAVRGKERWWDGKIELI
jgi:hypothetical protein